MLVTCDFCKGKLEEEQAVLTDGLFFHSVCFREREYRDQIFVLLKKIGFSEDTFERINSQISSFRKHNNYSYEGILKALRYYYLLKNGSVDKANGGIGIVPYVYDDAADYYFKLKLKQNQFLQGVQAQQGQPKKTVTIVATPKKRKEF